MAGPAVPGDQPGELGRRQAGDLAQKPSEEALGGSPEAVVAEADERAADEGVGGVAVGEMDLDRVVAFMLISRWKTASRSCSLVVGQDWDWLSGWNSGMFWNASLFVHTRFPNP